MAVETPAHGNIVVHRTETVAISTRQERTWRAIIEAPRNGTFNVWVYREVVLLDNQGAVLSVTKIGTPVHRVAAAIAGQSVTLEDGTIITAAAVMESLPKFFDAWSEEDIAAGRR